MAIGATGCGRPSAEKLTAEEIAANAVTAYSKLDTVKMNMDWTMDIVAVLGGESMKSSTVADVTSSTNVAANEMLMTTNKDMRVPGEARQATDMYIVGGWVYERFGIPGLSEQWVKMRLSDELWAQQNQVAQQAELIESAIDVALVGTETVDSVDCYVLRIKPDRAALANWLNGQFPKQSDTDFSQADFAKMLESFSMKEWVAMSSFMAMKGDMSIVLRMSSADSGDFDKMTADIKATFTFYDHNKPVTITLPPEAVSATETPTTP